MKTATSSKATVKATHKIARNPAKNVFVPCIILARGEWTRVRETGTGRAYWTPELLIKL